MRILIVDDDKGTRMFLSKVLSALGEVVSAATGGEALDVFGRALAGGNPFGLISLDIIMPGLDGQSTLRAMRELEKRHGVAPGQEAKVMMVTACGDAGNVTTAFFEGQADGYIQKPLDLNGIRATLAQMGLQLP